MMYAFNSINATRNRNKSDEYFYNSVNEDSFNDENFTPNLEPVNNQLILKVSSLSPIINNDSIIESKNKSDRNNGVVLFMRKSSEIEEESDVM